MELPKFQRNGHSGHCIRCITGLGPAQVDYDTSRMAVGFYCIASLDVLGVVEQRLMEHERESIPQWIWRQHIRGAYGAGFRGSTSMTAEAWLNLDNAASSRLATYNQPDLIMTYTALLLLSIFRDPFTHLDRSGLVKFIGSCQQADGSFTVHPGEGDADLRTSYCAFAIASMLEDWSSINLEHGVDFILRCQSYEGGFGQAPGQEAVGGTTYCALAALALAAASPSAPPSTTLSSTANDAVLRWLIMKQRDAAGGFCGRTEKVADACYSFWCGAALAVLGHADLVDTERNAAFLALCQTKYGGLAKAPDELPDPFHTYMALASLSIYPPDLSATQDDAVKASWKLGQMDPMLNATLETAAWARTHIPLRKE
ncbi:terpenoid cyclases/Protein prenyltransferase [Exidia glandulosa HHB12029]|uniref:Terpenoid cyclases/Protein prenyltransferase n=1 Tax=Exidia glandulosa HHB12029 TaxID=1314781 RepID=A0A165HVU1_EXIGL|nr:terpenoid cyclases/Protein prenyltransferase [Exidia glandulosa HHB12029]